MLPFPYSTKLFTKRPFFHALKIFHVLPIIIWKTKIKKTCDEARKLKSLRELNRA